MQNFWQILAKVYIPGWIGVALICFSLWFLGFGQSSNYESQDLAATNVTRNFIMEWKKWYSVSKIVLTYCEKKKSSDQEKLLKFEVEGKIFEITRTIIQTVKGQNNFR